MGLAAAVPQDWSVLQVYFVITIIISLVGWTELARVVRGRFLALREEDFVIAAELAGASQMRIILRHMPQPELTKSCWPNLAPAEVFTTTILSGFNSWPMRFSSFSTSAAVAT